MGRGSEGAGEGGGGRQNERKRERERGRERGREGERERKQDHVCASHNGPKRQDGRKEGERESTITWRIQHDNMAITWRIQRERAR